MRWLTGCPSVEPPVDEHGDAVPPTKDGDGSDRAAGKGFGRQCRARRCWQRPERAPRRTRRAMPPISRCALRWSRRAEKRLDERTAAAAAARSADQRAGRSEASGEDDAQFKAVVSMYETMKRSATRPRSSTRWIMQTCCCAWPARSIRARWRRSLPRMDAERAKDLTAAMASDAARRPMVADAGERPRQPAADRRKLGRTAPALPGYRKRRVKPDSV